MTSVLTRRWAVCDMDDGVLRWEPTRAAAVRWFLDWADKARVRTRHQYGDGAYEYSAGAGDDIASAFIMRGDVVGDHGWNPEQEPLYPVAGQPFELRDRKPEPIAPLP